MARDILSIPATGAGVERLFNSARDICHYRRGSLHTKTIQELMMFMCTSRFEIEEEQRALVKEYLSNEEIQAANEEKAKPQDEFEPISDDEEHDSLSGQDQPAPEAPSQRALGKRRKSVASEPDEQAQEPEYDDETEPLPETQVRTSGRARKRARYLDGYEVSRA